MNIFRTLKKAVYALSAVVQKAVIAVSLVLIYVLGIGGTALFVLLFRRTSAIGRYAAEDSWWRSSDGDDAGMEDALRQS